MRHALLLSLLVPSAAFAQAGIRPENVIQVVGVGKVSTPPDVAVIDYWVRGEGKTPDEATRSLVAMRKSIGDQVGTVLGGQGTATDSELLVLPVRGEHCDENAGPRLSEANCAILGYVARTHTTIRTPALSKAGTAVGLASRLGASDARLQGYQLSDTRPAERAALADAVANATTQAAAVAAAAHRRLGAILSIRAQNSAYREIVVTGSPIPARGMPAPPPPPPPVQINLEPQPIETNARVDVTYALLP